MTGLSRGGASLIEALVALLLGLAIIQGALMGVAKARIEHGRLVERADLLSSVRVTAAILRAEVEGGIPGVDWAVHDDSLSLRAFRGTGLVCRAESSADRLTVAWAGYRRPDPTKDSVWIVDGRGVVSVVGLVGVEPGPDSCGDQPLERGITVRTSAAVTPEASIMRAFERGAYSVTGAALRYRRGAGGRQPLTAELFRSDSGWRLDHDLFAVSLIERESSRLRRTAGGAAAPPRSWRIGVAPWPPR